MVCCHGLDQIRDSGSYHFVKVHPASFGSVGKKVNILTKNAILTIQENHEK